MDTIIYLKMARRPEQVKNHEPNIFHIRPVIKEDSSLTILHVTIPKPDEKEEKHWPAALEKYLIPFFGFSSSVDTVLHSSVKTWLQERKLTQWWRKIWPYPEYQDYHREEYGAYLLEKSLQHSKEPLHFYILGYEDFVPGLLSPYLKQIKTLTFVIASKTDESLEEYVEDLYEEEGLAAKCQILEENGYRSFRPVCQTPALVLDLTGEERVVPCFEADSIIWLDMDSNEAKKRKIQSRCRKTSYFSMKEEWGSLDTVDKNRYNT